MEPLAPFRRILAERREARGPAGAPVLVLGVTGHRPDKLDVAHPGLRAACLRVLDHLRSAYPDASFEVLSPLAEGADRLVARLAMERLGARLLVPLPMPPELYAEDFGAAGVSVQASLEELRALLARAERVFELPLVGGSEAALAGPGGAEGRGAQYALAGACVVEGARELIAVWDGRATGHTGGTGEIVRWWTEGLPREFRDVAGAGTQGPRNPAHVITPDGRIVAGPLRAGPEDPDGAVPPGP
jgi:hypothetical protein